MAKWPAQGIDPETQTLINMEWGAFRSSSLPRLPEDEALDAEFPNTGQYWFEKMMSGMYLGDLARRVLLSLAQEVQLFGEQVCVVGQHAGCCCEPLRAAACHTVWTHAGARALWLTSRCGWRTSTCAQAAGAPGMCWLGLCCVAGLVL